MSELTLGGWMAGNFSHPSPVYNPETGLYEHDGMVWLGKWPVGPAGIWALYDYMTSAPGSTWESPIDMFKAGVHLDRLSLVGTYHPDWNSHYSNSLDPDKRNGGKGSKSYKMQRIAKGVKFAVEPIWHYTPDGDLVKEIPPNLGAYHSIDMGDGYFNQYVGPEPGSKAEEQLGDGYYVFDEENGWYDVEGGTFEIPMPPEATITECPHCVAEFLDYIGDRPQ